jgi:general secretion pathway protein G
MKQPLAKSARHKKGVVADILLALLVVAVIAGAVAPRLIRSSSKHISPTRADIAALSGALQLFKADCGRYPTDTEGLSALKVAPSALLDTWKGPYFEQPICLDEWGHAFQYEQHGSGKSDTFVIKSFGPTGLPGGTGDNAEIVGGSNH